MKNHLKLLFGFYLFFVLVKGILSYFIASPTMFNDEFLYAKMAMSFFNQGKFLVYGIPSMQYYPLYPIFLSLSYFFKDMVLTYTVMKVINSFLSSLIIFPAYLLGREFFSQKRALLISVFVSLIPMNFGISPYIMAENLFYPLFLFSIYFIYKSLKEIGYKFSVLGGIFIGLSYLTKINGVVLFLALFSVLTINLFKKNFKVVKRNVISLVLGFFMIIPWLIRNAINFGFSLKGIFIYGGNQFGVGELHALNSFSLVPFLSWIFLYLGYLIVASGIIFFVHNFKKSDLNGLLWFSVAFSILIASFHNSLASAVTLSFGRNIGRYLDMILPVIFISGFSLMRKNKINKVVYACVLVTFLISIFVITKDLLLPINNLNVSYLGALKLFFSNFGVFIALPIFILFVSLKRFKKIFAVFLVFFILINILNFGITYYNARFRWYNLEQTQIGLWFNEFDNGKSVVLFDERDQQGINLPGKQPSLRAAFWMNNEIRRDNIDNLKNIDYIISSYDLDYKLVKDGLIKVYEVS